MISALLLAATVAATPPNAAAVRAVRLQHLSTVVAQLSIRRTSGTVGTQPEAMRVALASALNHSMQKATALKLLRTTLPRPRPKHRPERNPENALGNSETPADPPPLPPAEDSSKSV